MQKYTFHKKAAAWTYSGVIVTIPDCVFANQKEFDESGKFFPVIFKDGRKARAKLRGDLYGLATPGTGDPIVSLI